MKSNRFDVFLCHNSQDKSIVKNIGQTLRDCGLEPWLDEWHLPPGRPWQEELETQIENIGAAAVFVGKSGLGPWQNQEIRAFLNQFVERECPVIPVILHDCQESAPELPVFLRSMTWVDFRKSDPDPLEQLVWGITGQRADRPSPRYPNTETRDLSLALKAAYKKRALMEAQGHDITEVIETILDLRRKIREGGQLKAGDVLLNGRLELLQLIGRGGFAQVWKAYDDRRHTVVAVKVLHNQYSEDRTRRERFFRGARQMARLQHRGIVRVLEEHCEDGGYHFFVMEYIGGGDLRKAVNSGRLSIAERQRIILEAGEALSYAHERGIIHRDVKPGNILLDTQNRSRLTDFDLVRAPDTTGGTRTTGLGTYLYAAPEAMMDADKAGVEADVYSLGMTAIFAFHGSDLPHDLLRSLPKFIDNLRVSELAGAVIRRAVASEANFRWTTVADFCRALRRPPSNILRHAHLSESERGDIIRLLREESVNKIGRGIISAEGIEPTPVNYVISGPKGSVEPIGRDSVMAFGMTKDRLIVDTKDQVLEKPLAKILEKNLKAELTLSGGETLEVRVVGLNMKFTPAVLLAGAKSSYEIEILGTRRGSRQTDSEAVC